METEYVKKQFEDIFPQSPIYKHENVMYMGDDPVVSLEVIIRDSEIVLNNIRVSNGFEGKGYATDAMKLLLELSEYSKFMITAIVEANGQKHMNNKQLLDWYLRLGFKKGKGNEIAYYPKSLY